jgi:hypothetical protein
VRTKDGGELKRPGLEVADSSVLDADEWTTTPRALAWPAVLRCQGEVAVFGSSSWW